MRLICLFLCMLATGCVVQVDDVPPSPVPSPDVVAPVDNNFDAAFLQKLVADPTVTKELCMRHAALYQAYAQSFREREDVAAALLLDACYKTADQFVAPHPVITEQLNTLKSIEKSRASLASAFEKMSVTLRHAAAKR